MQCNASLKTAATSVRRCSHAPVIFVRAVLDRPMCWPRTNRGFRGGGPARRAARRWGILSAGQRDGDDQAGLGVEGGRRPFVELDRAPGDVQTQSHPAADLIEEESALETRPPRSPECFRMFQINDSSGNHGVPWLNWKGLATRANAETDRESGAIGQTLLLNATSSRV
jgi:hypothetical protein